MGLLCCRQGEPEYGALRLISVHPQPTPVGDDDGTADRQPHPDSAGLRRVEGFKNPLGTIPIDARSRIAHFHNNAARLDLLDSDSSRAPSSTEFIASTAFRTRFRTTCCS